MSIFLLLHSLSLAILPVMNCNDMGRDRDLLIQILSDPKEMGLIKKKLEKLKGL